MPVAVINAGHYPFWLTQTWLVTLRIQEWVFSGSTVPPDSKETIFESSNPKASPSTCKNTRIALVIALLPCHTWKCVPTAISGGVDIPVVPSVICYNRGVLIKGHKNYLKDWCLIKSQPTIPIFILFLCQ